MGELLTPVPTTPGNVTDSWAPLVDSNVMSSYGMNVVTLTNWDATTTRPEIAQGSVIEIDGSLAVFTVTEDLGNTNPPDGTVYVKFTVTGTSVEARLTGTVPSWNATLGGWYNGSGERYSGHLMTKNGTSYTNKGRYRDESDGEQLIIEANRGIDTNTIDAGTVNATTGNITTVNSTNENVSGTLSVDTLADVQKLSIRASGMAGTYGTFVVNGSILIPAGCYMIASADDTGGNDKVYLQVYTGSAWEGDVSGGPNDYWWPGGLVMSDGVNYRFSSSGGAVTLHYRKIW